MIDYRVPLVSEIEQAQAEAMARADAIVAEVVALPDAARSFANTLKRLEDAADLLTSAQGRYGFMSYVAEDAGVRAAAEALRESLEKYAIDLSMREDVYRAVKSYAATEEAQRLQGEDRRLLEHTLRDFKRDGFELAEAQRLKVRELKQRLVELEVAFQRNIATWNEAILVSREELAGLPEAYITALQTEERDGQTLYRVSLDYPEMYPFLDNAEAEAPRRELMQKNYRKGGPENVRILEEAIVLRDQMAGLLGYASWAEYGLELRMAKTPATVTGFLDDLIARVAAKRDLDLAGLREAKRQHTGDPAARLELWDWRFYHNYLMKTRFAVDDFAVAQYFPLDAVLRGLFETMQTLFSLRFEEVTPASAWHADVRLYRVFAAGSQEEAAYFYMDLFPRANKFGHAAAFTLAAGRALSDGGYQKPVSAIVANFTKPTATTPSLLRHSEVVTLFHEFGHILHQTLTRARHLRFSGTSTENDFVEAPSQMLEHWVWRPQVLAGFSRHVESGEPLPAALLEAMIAAKNLDSGVFAARQLYFASLDLAYHAGGEAKDTTALAASLHPISGFEAPDGTHWQSGFGHLFGYDAGYYGYKWSEVFADDMFTRFEPSPLDTALGLEYRQLVLERGGSVDGETLVRDFLGREPNNAAFLKNLGL